MINELSLTYTTPSSDITTQLRCSLDNDNAPYNVACIAAHLIRASNSNPDIVIEQLVSEFAPDNIRVGRKEDKWNPETHQLEDIPKPHAFKPFERVLVRDDEEEEWSAQLYSCFYEKAETPYECMGNFYKYCIPYEGNEHLLGTTDSPKGGNQ